MPGILAVDLGAESGRVVRAELGADRLAIREVARFPTGMVQREGHLRWELPRIWGAVEDGLRAAAASGPVESVGVDAWGLDFGLLDAQGSLIELPVAYRDPRTEGVMERFFERVPAETIYRKTGIQFMSINTLFQLTALAESRAPVLEKARHLLLIPDLFHYYLSGRRCSEFTDATTTQCFNVQEQCWDRELLQAARVDPDLMQEVVASGTVLGPLTQPVGEKTGLDAVLVVAPGTHDTASAVAATPATGEEWAYISSGTWSLIGVETPAPIVTAAARELNFTNEGGVCGTNRLLKNVMGLWLVQRCRADFHAQYDYTKLTRLAAEAPPFASLMDPDEPRFLNPPSMPDAIAGYCNETGQKPPQTPGAFVRCALESLALRYRSVLDELRGLLARPIRRIHVVGGGARNDLLCQMTANATGLEVRAGPPEATALGNTLVQAQALGRLGSLAEARELVGRSFEVAIYEPREAGAWEEALGRFSSMRTRP